MVKEIIRKIAAESESSSIHLYSAFDPIPVPEAIESDTEAAWALWEDALSPKKSGPDADSKDVRPAELPPWIYLDSLKNNH